jgi:dCMP deaminase
MNINRPSWNKYFMEIATLASSRSSCNRLHVGCVIVKDNHILATGYNGFLSGCPHQSIVLNNHEQATVHAEQNAISYAAKFGVSLKDSTCYCTHYPCINCFKVLVAAGIKKIYYKDNYKNSFIVHTLAKQANIEIIHFNKKKENP